MNAIEIARQAAALGAPEEACRAYALALRSEALKPEEMLEAAISVLQFGEDYKLSYTCLYRLYRQGQYPQECLDIMTEAFYHPNAAAQKAVYSKNCKALKKYPYLFRKDFLPFEALPIRFYPFDDHGYLPFHTAEERFDDYINFRNPVISRNFFRELERPILAADVYSQYELEYLHDNIRKSEWVGRENHLYLHYTDWATFCAYLQVLDLRAILKEEKPVFLIADEISQYPIDFKARFGLDYSHFPVQPIGVREIKRLIWHAQLSSHNGGDFFNEIFDGHPNLLATPSVMMEKMENKIAEWRQILDLVKNSRDAERLLDKDKAYITRELCLMKDRTDRDILVGCYLADPALTAGMDPAARIAPALFLQPHFGNLKYKLYLNRTGQAVMHSKQYEAIQRSPIFQNFKYIKTFVPMRRSTTGYGAAVRFLHNRALAYQRGELEEAAAVDDALSGRILNRSYWVAPEDPLYTDSVLVRFEDGKLNPKATFTALTAFLDLPYTDSMTYCSFCGERDPESMAGNVRGFDPASVYRSYDEYANDAERAFIEYFMRDAYTAYGYDFHYYDGRPVDEAQADRWIDHFDRLENYISTAWRANILPKAHVTREGQEVTEAEAEWARNEAFAQDMKGIRENWRNIAKSLLYDPQFISKNGQPLHMLKMLTLDPALLEQPLYH